MSKTLFLSGIVKLTFVIVIQVGVWYAYYNLIYRREEDDKSCFFAVDIIAATWGKTAGVKAYLKANNFEKEETMAFVWYYI